jgi:hypothetical protein
MRIRGTSGGGLFVACAAAIGVASCSSSSNSGNGNPAATPGSLVSTCDQICNNVVAQCAGASAVQCLSACDDLNLVPNTCLNPIASYLVCLSGATSVQCEAGGQYVLVAPADCRDDEQAVTNCNAGPSVVAACLELPGNTSCASSAAGSKAAFCVGAPNGCQAPKPNPIGIGVYCCP